MRLQPICAVSWRFVSGLGASDVRCRTRVNSQFRHRDSHWSAAGIDLFEKVLAQLITSQQRAALMGSKRYERRDGQIERWNDLVVLLELPGGPYQCGLMAYTKSSPNPARDRRRRPTLASGFREQEFS